MMMKLRHYSLFIIHYSLSLLSLLSLASLATAAPIDARLRCPTEKECTAKSYVQNGLIAMWDGIENAGWGVHDATATVWKNLGSTGSTYDATAGSAKTWLDKGAYFERNWGQVFTIPAGFMNTQAKGEWTLEVVFSPLSRWVENYSGIFGNHGSGLGWDWGQVKFFGLYSPTFQFIGSSGYSWIYGDKYSVSCGASATAGATIAVINGEIFGEKACTASQVTLTQSSAIYIGAAFGSGERVFHGTIFAVRVYNRKLTANEIAYNYAVDKERFGL